MTINNNGGRGDPRADDVLATARVYLAAGFSVIPVLLDGSKQPAAEWKPFQETRPDDKSLVSWFSRISPLGIGLVCGAVSGNLEVIDGDDLPLCPEYFELVKTHDPDLYKSLVIVETPSGCNHVLFRCEQIEGNQKLAMRGVEVPEGTKGAKKDGDRWVRLEVLFETRGQGGYIIAPGSPLAVHSAGRPYRFIKGSAATVPTITPDQRELLFGLARALNEYHPKEESREKTEYKQVNREAVAGLRPGDDYNERGSPLDVLLNHGWTVSHRRGAIIHLKKPGAKGRGHHATLHAIAHNVFYCFSTSAAPFDSERRYTPFELYATLEHNGNFKAAAKALVALGYGTQLKAKKPEFAASQCTEDDKLDYASELCDVMNLIHTEWGWDDALKVTFSAMHGLAGGRQTFPASKKKIANRIRKAEKSEAEDCESDEQFGRRRLKDLRSALKLVAYPTLSIKKRGGEWKTNGKRKYRAEAEYNLNMGLYVEAHDLAWFYFNNWKEERKNYPAWSALPPNVGLARLRACVETAWRYVENNSDTETKRKRNKLDAATKEKNALDGLIRQAKALGKAWDESLLPDGDRQVLFWQLNAELKKILLTKKQRNRQRRQVFAEKWPITHDTPFSEARDSAPEGPTDENMRTPIVSEDSLAYAPENDLVDSMLEDDAEGF